MGGNHAEEVGWRERMEWNKERRLIRCAKRSDKWVVVMSFPMVQLTKDPLIPLAVFFCFFACFLSSIFSLIWSPVNSNPSSSSRHHTTATNQGGRRVLCASAKTRDAECIFSNWRSWKISIYLLSHTWGNRCSWLASIEGDYSIPPLAPGHGWLWHC